MLSPVWPLPANNGGLVRIHHIFHELSKNHEVILVSPEGIIRAGLSGEPIFEERGLSRGYLPGWIKKCFTLVSWWPYHAAYYWDPWMKAKVEQLLAEPDFSLVYCHFIYTLPYVSAEKICIVLDQQNVDRQYWERKLENARNILERLSFKINLYKTIMFEEHYLSSVTAIISVSDIDRKNTKKYAQHLVQHFLVAPNGVEPEKFWLDNRVGGHSSSSAKVTIGFMGSLDLELNRRAAQLLATEIFPAVKKEIPEQQFTLLLIGRNPPPDIVEYSFHTPEIIVTNTVSDVRPYLSKVDILVLPLKGGGGTKLRVLEGMAMGLPIVGSPDALQGIQGLLHDQNVLIAHSPSEFYEFTSRLINNKEDRFRLGNSARNLVLSSYSWRKIVTDLNSALTMLIPDFQPREPISIDSRLQEMLD